MSATASLPVDDVEPTTQRQVVIAYFALMLGMLLGALDQTVVSTALPTIVGDLGGLNELSWVVTAYLLTSTVSTPIYGKLSDLYGGKRILQGAIVIFLLGSLMSGVSTSMTELIVFRAVQGIGAGGLGTLGMGLAGQILSPRERGRYFGYGMAIISIASISGPLVGGLFTQHLSWRWCFYINMPIGIAVLVILEIVLTMPFHRLERRFDFMGASLLVAGVSGLLLVTVWGGNEYPWVSSQILGLAAASVALLIGFVWFERRAEEPLMPLRLFHNAIVNVTATIAFLSTLVMLSASIYLPLFLQLVTGASPTLSGVLILPLTIGVIVASITTGRMISRTGRYKRNPIVGSVLVILGVCLLSFCHPESSRLNSGLFLVPLGIGIGMVMPMITLAAQNATDRLDTGTVTSLNTFFRTMGGTFGVALFGSILAERLRYWLPRELPRNAVHHLSSSVAFSPAAVRQLPPATRNAIVQAFGHSLHSIFLWTLPFSVLLFISVIVLREIPLRSSAHIVSTTSASQ